MNSELIRKVPVEIRETIADRLGDIVQILKDRLGDEKLAAQMQKVKNEAESLELHVRRQEQRIRAMTDRLEANEQAVQSCITMLGEQSELLVRIAEKQT